MNGQTIRTITIRGTSEGLDKLTADVNKLAAAEQNVAIVSEQSARRILSLEQAYQRQTLRLDEAARAQANFARESKLASDAMRQGLASPEQHAQRMDVLKQRYGQVNESTKQMITGMTAAGSASQRMISGMSGAGEETAKGVGLARHELINLSRQAQDVAVSLASGQSPFTVLLQQGSQIADVFVASGKSVGSFFSQAIGWATRFLATPAGIVTGIAAIGAAAVYAASQFLGASKTIEQALEEQNRLLKESKALVDAKTSAEAKLLGLQGQTKFEMRQNEILLQQKLNDEMQKTIKLTERAITRPTQVSGEMGEAPTGIAPLKDDPGIPQLYEALERLKAAWANNQLGARAFANEVGNIGLEFGKVNPAITKTVEKLLEFGRTAAALELTNVQAREAAAAYERQAAAILQLTQVYPGMSIEVSKQAHALERQLELTQARTGAEEIILRYQQQIADAGLKGLSVAEATLLAELQRKNAVAQVNAQADQMLKNLEQEYELIKATSEAERDRIRARQTYENLVDKGADATKAQAVASQQLTNAEERRSREARSAAVQQSVEYEQAYDAEREAADARVLAYQRASAAAASESIAISDALDAAIDLERTIKGFVPFQTSLGWATGTGGGSIGGKMWTDESGRLTQFNPAGYTSTDMRFVSNWSTTSSGKLIAAAPPSAPVDPAQAAAVRASREIAGGKTIFDAITDLLNYNPVKAMGTIQSLNELVPKDRLEGELRREIEAVKKAPPSLEQMQVLKQLEDSLRSLTESVDDNTDALKAQIDPLFSQGHEYLNTLKIGYYKAAGGLQGVVGGYGGTDSKRFVMDLSPGELVQVTPPGEWRNSTNVANDNSRNVTQHITINIEGGDTPVERLTARQRAQGFIKAATMAAG